MSAIGALRQLEKEKSKDAGKGGIKVRAGCLERVQRGVGVVLIAFCRLWLVFI